MAIRTMTKGQAIVEAGARLAQIKTRLLELAEATADRDLTDDEAVESLVLMSEGGLLCAFLETLTR